MGAGLVAGFVDMYGADKLLGVVMPIKHVRIQGEFANIDPQELERQILPLVRAGYIMADLRAIKKAALDVYWMNSVTVFRIWPDIIQLDVNEHIPVARWGDQLMLDEKGEVFRISSLASDFYDLPMVHAPYGHEVEVLGMINKLNEILMSRGTSVTTIRLSDRLAWTVLLSDDLEISYGIQNPLMATNRMFTLLPALGDDRLASIKKVDLRYPTGFAVTWKSQLTENVATHPEQSPH